MKIFLMTSLIILSSCSTSVQLEGRGCSGAGQWSAHESKKRHSGEMPYDFQIEKRVWSPFGFIFTKTVVLKELIEEEKMKCSELVTLSVEVKNAPIDYFFNILPFFATKTLVLTGTFRSQELIPQELSPESQLDLEKVR